MIADIIGIVVGFIAADKFPIIASGVLYIWNDGSEDYQRHLAEASLIILFLFSFIAVWLGAVFSKRGWVTDRQIMLSMFTAIVIAAFTIVDQSLPDRDGYTRIEFGNTIYYLGWPAVLYLLAPVLLPRVGDDSKMRSAVFLMAVSCVVALACYVSGAILVEVARLTNRAMGVLDGGIANFRDPLRFWLLRPSIVSPIAGASVVVAFAPLWWPHLWSESRALAKCAWIMGYSFFSVAYAGLYGKVVFAKKGWVENLVGCEPSISDWRFFVLFAAYAGAAFVAVGLCVFLTRDTKARRQGSIGWPISDRFWWWVPAFIGGGLVIAVVLFVLPVVTHCEEASGAQTAFLVIAHFVAGLVLGVSLRLFGVATRLIPAELRRS